MAALGDRWASGQLSVLDEHLASERLARSLARMCEWLPANPEAPRSLLVTAVGDDHTIGLSLVELCLREAGWATLWGGRRTPSPEVARAIELHRVRLVVVSASSASTDGRALAEQAGLLGQSCRLHGARLIVGGRGAWPHRLAYGEVIRDFATLHEWAERRGPGGAPATGSSP